MRTKPRRWIVGILVVLTCLSALAAMVSVWARALILNTDRWTEMADRVIREPEVVNALSFRLSTSIVEALDVETRVETALAAVEQLPDQATLLAGPLTAGVQGILEERIATFLRSDTGREAWSRVNRFAHERIVAVLRGETPTGITIEDGTATLNTAVIIDGGLMRAEDLISDILGREVTLPTAEELEASGTADRARALLEERLGVDLPENFGELVLFRSDRLAAAQDAVRILDRFVVLILIVTLILLVATLVLSTNRRRTLIQLGIGLLVAALAARLAVRATGNAIVDLAVARSRDAVGIVMSNVFSGLVLITTIVIIAAVIVGVGAYLAGRPAWLERLRTRLSAAASSDSAGSARTWVAAHRDGLRLAGVAVALIVLFLVGLSWVSVIVVLLLLGAYELGVGNLASREGTRSAQQTVRDTVEPGESGR
jgi:hypothetical protein